MKETILIPAILIAFACLVALALSLERMVEKRRRKYLKQRKPGLQMSYPGGSLTGLEEDIRVPVSDLDENTSNTPGKLDALEQVNV